MAKTTKATVENSKAGEALGALEAQFLAARRCSTPILAVSTPDAYATQKSLGHAADSKTPGATPLLSWDLCNGLRAMPGSEAGKAALASLPGEEVEATMQNPVLMLAIAHKLPKKAVLFFHLANRVVAGSDADAVLQGIANLRDVFKQDMRTLVLLAVGITLPPEIAGDVITLDEPLPDRAKLAEILTAMHTHAEVAIPSPENLEKAIDAVMGLPAFQAEQCAAMCLKKSGLNIDQLWERKRKQVEQTPGLAINRDGIKFDSLGGLHEVKAYVKEILEGNDRPNAIVFVDELEKVMAGSRGDTSGVSQDQLQQLLTFMQDENAIGIIFVGHPGTGKSAMAKAAGNEAGIPTIKLDLGAAKGSLVGQSEATLRAALKTIKSVSNGRALWIATSNGLDEIKPELLARFRLGTVFFDLPDAEERGTIWAVHRAKYGIADNDATPDSAGWVGREIEACCEIAYRTNKPLSAAAKRIVPGSKSNPAGIERLQERANNKWLAAAKPGVYLKPSAAAAAEPAASGPRKMDLE